MLMSNADLSPMTMTDAKLDGMTIEGIPVTDFLRIYRRTIGN